MQKSWRIAMAVVSLFVVAAATAAMFMPLIQTQVSYGAWAMDVDGSFIPSSSQQSVEYDSTAFDDDKHGKALRAIAPMLIGAMVTGLLAGLGALFPRVAGVLISSVLGLVAALAAGGAVAAAWYGSKFADGAKNMGDLGAGGWLLAVAAAAALVTLVLAMVIGGAVGIARLSKSSPSPEPPTAGVEPARSQPRSASSRAQDSAEAAVRLTAGPPVRHRLASVTILTLAALVAVPTLMVALAKAGSYRYHAFGYHHLHGSWRHGGTEVKIMATGGALLAAGALAALVVAVLYVIERATQRPSQQATWIGFNFAAGAGLMGGATVLAVGLWQLNTHENATVATGATWVAIVGALAVLAWVPIWVNDFRSAATSEQADQN